MSGKCKSVPTVRMNYVSTSWRPDITEQTRLKLEAPIKPLQAYINATFTQRRHEPFYVDIATASGS